MKKSKIADLPAGVGVTRNSNGSSEYWKVRLGKKFTGGSVVSRNFKTLAGAREWIFGEARQEKAAPGAIIALKETAGTAAFSLSPRQLAEASDAFKRCEEAGLSLTEAVSFAIAHSRPVSGAITVTDAIDALVKDKEKKGKREIYLEKLKAKLLRFARSVPAKTTLNQVTGHKIEKFLHGLNLSPEGELIQLRHMSVLFGWAVKKGYMAENPCAKIEKPTVDRQPPVIFVPTQALSLLKVARELTPWVVVGLFAGLRPDEAKRLSWEDVDFKRRHIDLPADKAKGRRRRIIPFLGNLEAWLLPYQRKTGSIVPANFRRRFWKMAERAGFRQEKNAETERRQNRKAETPAGWPKDVLRHSFGSYHLAAHKSASLTAELMGHMNSRMLYEHYREVIKEDENITAFWALHPDQLIDEKIVRGKFRRAA
jgi:integrase